MRFRLANDQKYLTAGHGLKLLAETFYSVLPIWLVLRQLFYLGPRLLPVLLTKWQDRLCPEFPRAIHSAMRACGLSGNKI